MSFTYATVTRNVELSPRLRRISLRIDDPGTLHIASGGDSAVGIYFPVAAPGGSRIAPPCVIGADGRPHLDPSSDAAGRNYSVRRHDGDRIDVDVVLHARGPGASWARGAEAADRVGLDHARSWYRPDPMSRWQLLVADLSGLPAAARIIEEHRTGAPMTVIIETVAHEDLDQLPSHPDVQLVVSVGTGNGHGPSRLAALVRDLDLPAGRGYCWFAGEAAEARAARKHLRGRGWTREQYDITGYWRSDSEAWDTRFALVEDDVLAVYERALADGKGDKVASEEFDEALERAGL